MNDEILPNVLDFVLKETRKLIRYDSIIFTVRQLFVVVV